MTTKPKPPVKQKLKGSLTKWQPGHLDEEAVRHLVACVRRLRNIEKERYKLLAESRKIFDDMHVCGFDRNAVSRVIWALDIRDGARKKDPLGPKSKRTPFASALPLDSQVNLSDIYLALYDDYDFKLAIEGVEE